MEATLFPDFHYPEDVCDRCPASGPCSSHFLTEEAEERKQGPCERSGEKKEAVVLAGQATSGLE